MLAQPSRRVASALLRMLRAVPSSLLAKLLLVPGLAQLPWPFPRVRVALVQFWGAVPVCQRAQSREEQLCAAVAEHVPVQVVPILGLLGLGFGDLGRAFPSSHISEHCS